MSLYKSLPIASDPFYVDPDCCTACGVPDVIAPHLFGTNNDNSCYVKRQPEHAFEVDRMLLTMISAEFGCIRYAGTDVEIRKRLAEQGYSALCDNPLEKPIESKTFDHAGLKIAHIPYSLEGLVDDFKAFLARQRSTFQTRIESQTPTQIEVGVNWYEDRYHSVTMRKSEFPEFDWVVVGLPFVVSDWLSFRAKIFIFGFYSAADWKGSRTDRRRVPW